MSEGNQDVTAWGAVWHCVDCGARVLAGEAHVHERVMPFATLKMAAKTAGMLALLSTAIVFALLWTASVGMVLLKGLYGLWREILPFGC